MARRANNSLSESRVLSQLQKPHFERTGAASVPNVGTLVTDIEGNSDSATPFEIMPSQVVSLLNDAAHSLGHMEFASLSTVEQCGLYTALWSLAKEAPTAFARISRFGGYQCLDNDRSPRAEDSNPQLAATISIRRFIPTNRIMNEMRSGNHPSSADDFFGKQNLGPDIPSFTLADLLRAAISGMVDPEAVFKSFPSNLHSLFDDLARRAGGSGFLGIPKEAQRALFSAFLEAVSQAKPTTSAPVASSPSSIASKPQVSKGPTSAPPKPSPTAAVKKPTTRAVKKGERPTATQSTKAPPAKSPWWKFW